MTLIISRLSRVASILLLIFFGATTVAPAYTCGSIMGNVDCGRGNGRKDVHVDRRAREDTPISGHHAHRHPEYPWCSVGIGGHHSHCGYANLEQCLQTVRGTGGLCNKKSGLPHSQRAPLGFITDIDDRIFASLLVWVSFARLFSNVWE